ncbi:MULTISPECIES: ankyrin repeat domain-containing protein [unclassified Streptomyces]|uniref:ankyrin repeat domain-containing protein n=1 Tax=unclassified Streptomyces TaxID=2593676 RepID=UPI0036E49EDF
MSPGKTVGYIAPDEMASRRQVRRYAVPRRMIEESARRRAAGDWQGACAAARFDVRFDLARVSERYGPDVAGALASDLLHLVPDLVRWHLPRVLGGRSTLATDRTVILAGYGRTPDGPTSASPYLYLRTLPMVDGPQRIALRFGTAGMQRQSAPVVFRSGFEDWRTARYLWDGRRTGELRTRAGGADRVPFLHADGTPLGAGELPAADPGSGDPVARAEWLTLLHHNGHVAESLAAAGIEWDPTPPQLPAWYQATPETIMAGLALDVPRVEANVRRFAEQSPAERFLISKDWRANILLEFTDHGPLRMSLTGRREAEDAAFVPEAAWRRLPDIDLLRSGGMSPGELHPLVAGALVTGIGPVAGPPEPTPPAPVRVRCRGTWHEVVFRDGALASPHTPQERQRENALRAFGGAVTGCFAVEHACVTGKGPLPKALRAQRRDLFLRVQHGDTPGVLDLLDAGVDLRVRDAGQRSLLHVLHLIDHTLLLPRLLAAGLDLEATDHQGRTPLCAAVDGGGSPALVQALLEAGARIDVLDQMELSLDQLIRKYRRTDLDFLRERVEREHPGIGTEWWEEWQEEGDHADEEDEDD